MTTQMTLQEYQVIEKVRVKEIKEMLKQACKLLRNVKELKTGFKTDKFLLLKYEACVEDLNNINHLIFELLKLREKIDFKDMSININEDNFI